MIPKAKKNLHECAYHLENLLNSKNFEEAEINFAAFVNSARNTTFVLQKEFKKNSEFIKWYGDSKKEKILCKTCGEKQKIPVKAKEGTKQYEMKHDELCHFFHKLRSQIVHEGINKLNCSLYIKSMNTKTDYPDRPEDTSMEITNRGVFYRIHRETAKEDLIPAQSNTARIATYITISNCPTQHLGKKINHPNLFTITQLYYNYLKSLIEEWTGIINKSS